MSFSRIRHYAASFRPPFLTSCHVPDIYYIILLLSTNIPRERNQDPPTTCEMPNWRLLTSNELGLRVEVLQSRSEAQKEFFACPISSKVLLLPISSCHDFFFLLAARTFSDAVSCEAIIFANYGYDPRIIPQPPIPGAYHEGFALRLEDLCVLDILSLF